MTIDARWLSGQLAIALAERLPGPGAQRRGEPSLAYGRHCGPPPHGAREAAVVAVLCPGPNGWQIPLIVRPRTVSVHAGQISLPGGALEPGETSAAAALRELHEELGVASGEVELLGALTPLYVFNSNFLVRPWLALAAAALVFQAAPAEVAEVLTLPIARLVDPAALVTRIVNSRGVDMPAATLDVDGHEVWGATLMILCEVAAVCESLGVDFTVQPTR